MVLAVLVENDRMTFAEVHQQTHASDSYPFSPFDSFPPTIMAPTRLTHTASTSKQTRSILIALTHVLHHRFASY